MRNTRVLSLLLRCAVYGSVILGICALSPGGAALPAFAQGDSPPQGSGPESPGWSKSGEPAQGIVQDNQKPTPTFYGIDVQRYVRNGYAVAGPYFVSSANRGLLKLYTGLERDIQINLQQKKVKVMDTSGKELGLGKVTKDSYVLVLTKGSVVLVYVLPAKKERKDG